MTTDNGTYQDLATEVHELGALIQGVALCIGTGVVKLPVSLRDYFAGTNQTMVHQPMMGPAIDGPVWETFISQERFILRLRTQTGFVLHQWLNPVMWVPDVDFPGTKAWMDRHAR